MATVVNGMRSSAAWRIAERVRAAAVAATAQSAVLTALRRRSGAWLQLPWPERRLKGGALLAVAAVVHMVLIWPAHGWTEFILPLTVLLIATIAMASAALGSSPARHD